ncbi:hypothetical protein BEH_11745 [Priestia filamentosa]|uniref:DUF3383 family protein n=1 Tax=Priestia filamentosa TaxID=1402861 RepID=A0A0H4KF28_9BACI|nr:DUF3383 family protein [Priestia filamentosa]AKO92707.1 hypothetical protein BEH_11745 [Priestia filamentosa]
MPLQDVTVTIDILKPAAYIGFGKPLILAEKTGTSFLKSYKELDEVKVDFAESTTAYAKAKAVFAQKNRPATLSIASYDSAGSDVVSAMEALEKYYDEDWVFVVTSDAELTDQIAVADFVEQKGYKVYVAITVDEQSRNAFKAKGYERTIDFYHLITGEHPDAALIGEVANRPVGSQTWKFKTLVGITPIDVTKEELDAIHADGAIAYVTKAGIPQTSEGIVASGEYIDVMHGKDWIKFNMESRIQSVFANTDKVVYNSNGISLIEAEVTTVLQQAFQNGIIDADASGNALYTVTTKSREDMSITDREKRIYNGISFSYTAQGAIHESNIKGEILSVA